MQKRTRGYILTRQGAEKLKAAKREWESQHDTRCTQEKMKELTSAYKEDGLYTGTIRKIFKGEKEVDRESIHCLFSAFNLQLDDDDLISEPQACLPKLDPNFLGRDEAIADLNTFVSQGAKVICLYGKGGVGKTTLAKKYLSTREFDLVLEPPMAKETKNITPIESVVEELLRDLRGEPAQDFGITLKRLKQQLKTQRVGVLIDNLEPALDKDGKFIEPHRGYVELLSILADPDVQSVTLITSRERLNESRVSVKSYELKGLDEEAWQQYFSNRDTTTDSQALSEMWKAYEGNAKAMEILCSAIQMDYEGDIEAYWQDNQGYLLIERELDDLVNSQFERLETLDADAYRLLCRLGCYRYQEISSIPISGVLSMLWDIPEEQHRRGVKSLRDRSLLEFDKGGYWLHPVIREEAISRLGKDTEYKLANFRASDFWLIYGLGKMPCPQCPQMAVQWIIHCIEANFEAVEEPKLDESSENTEELMSLAEVVYIITYALCRNGIEAQQNRDFSKSNEYFQSALLIFKKLDDTEQSKKIQKIIQNGYNPYDLAEIYYKEGLNFQDNDKVDTSKLFFRNAIELFAEVGAYMDVEQVLQAIKTKE